jgi:hypothetical protein
MNTTIEQDQSPLWFLKARKSKTLCGKKRWNALLVSAWRYHFLASTLKIQQKQNLTLPP